MSAIDLPGWTEANQQFLAAELAWLRGCLEADPGLPGAAADVERCAAALPAPAAIDTLAELFELSAFERRLLLLCAGVELDARLAATCARAQGQDGRGYVTFGMALAALPEAHWSALTPLRPLRRWRLVDVDPGPRLVDSPLRIDERVLHFLAGINLLDARLHPLLTPRDAPRLIAGGHLALAGQLGDRWLESAGIPLVIHLRGNDPAGQEDVAAAIAERVGLQLFVLNGPDIPSPLADLGALLTLCEREMRLLGGALLVPCTDAARHTAVSMFADRLRVPLLVASADPLPLRRGVVTGDVNKPEPSEQRRLWLDALGGGGAALNGSLDALAARFHLSARTIGVIAEAAGPNEDDEYEARLWQACRSSSRTRLEELAERIPPAAGWDDLVLPEAPLAALRQIAAHVRQRVRVQEEWGFARRGRRGAGISVLFCGESGTGKTLAAEVLARELGLDLYRIDLSSVVSKYIGETEKNLKRVFDAAEDSGSILLFDEADALFGKRSEVKDSHDRYANIEVSYLLQRMEAYRGLAVLTTNMKTALDRAFQRRLRFIVTFPFPDSTLREAIWRRVFPPAAPLGAIDYRRLARLNVPGGNIRNIALNAAFLAADANASVGMAHLLAAAHAESAKLERPLSESELRGWS
jgi:SpoVK/Ycf46/Vps4 family AAA+-type ATPase